MKKDMIPAGVSLNEVNARAVKKLICCMDEPSLFVALADQLAAAWRAVLAAPQFADIPEPDGD